MKRGLTELNKGNKEKLKCYKDEGYMWGKKKKKTHLFFHWKQKKHQKETWDNYSKQNETNRKLKIIFKNKMYTKETEKSKTGS